RVLGNNATETTPDAAIAEGFIYEPETATFVRVRSAQVPTADSTSLTSDQLFTRYVYPALTQDEATALARTKRIDGVDYVWVRAFEDGTDGYEETAAPRNLTAGVTEEGAPGIVLPDKGLCLETTYDDRNGLPLERLWLQRDSDQQWTVLARESLESGTLGHFTREAGEAVAIVGASSVDVMLNDHGVLRHFLVSGKAPATQLPDSLYSGPVSAAILGSEVLSLQGVEVIPAACWSAITHASDTSDPAFKALSPCYSMGPDGDYHLADPGSYTSAQLTGALLALSQAALPAPAPAAPEFAATDGSMFRVLPSDPFEAVRLVLLTPDQLDALASFAPGGQAAAVRGCFQQLQAGSKSWWYPSPGLSSTDTTVLRAAMERCRRDRELFPYYT
ncbi:MAG TPA: hypothetical protein VL359_02185, partial [bacterium]|nr:hypothetical protein [bacterium]